jgi:hypothetical protein
MPQGEAVVHCAFPTFVIIVKAVGCGPEPPDFPPKMMLEQPSIPANDRTDKHPNHFSRTEFLSVS